MRGERRGFTLIELLVVIAIIAILAAILFPVFARARAAARKTSCLSNVKQVSLAVLQYVQDYDEKFPGWSWGRRYEHFSNEFWDAAVLPYVKNLGVFQCPEDGLEWPIPEDWVSKGPDAGRNNPFAGWPDRAWWEKPNNPNYQSYGINESLANGRKMAAIKTPANYMLITDSSIQLANSWEGTALDVIISRSAFANQGCCLIWENGRTAGWFLQNYPANTLDNATRHNGGENISFVDGHAKFFPWSKMDHRTLCAPQN
jgi:prepilin-type N-terminal cleavage/methylation domain-containing protein/prepilin-type processing-associated H-X9-DG protein